MNEAETRAEYTDKQLESAGWGVLPETKILREYKISDGKIEVGGGRQKKLIADYILVYKNIKLGVVEAKSIEREVGEGVAQAKIYAQKLDIEVAYSTNGKEIYFIDLKTGEEKLVDKFLTPDELWQKNFREENEWREKFNAVPFEDKSGSWQPRYYQEIAVRKVTDSIAENKQRILLTLATGTGKTAISFQIAWKLFQARWNIKRDGERRPRILFLADRNVLADQAFNSFSSFPEDALVRIKPNEIKKKNKVPKNGSVFFTIFQTFMSGSDKNGDPAPYFGEYEKDFFDLIIIDECHRGGANDESNWRDIMNYFSSAVQIGLTATPKRNENVDTYKYFGNPVYQYSLKEGINDGFLTPFKVKKINTGLDTYIYANDDDVIEGEIEENKEYVEKDFNKTGGLEIKEREKKRVQIYLEEADQNEKAIVFCANQAHALIIRDLINQNSKSQDSNYCVRVTANDGEIGEQYLREFQDNEKTLPTILTTSQKLSTGVDARNIRNIVLLREVNSMIEFKQIIGRGTRLYDGKDFFTIYDFVGAYKNFLDPEWDGDPVLVEEETRSENESNKKENKNKICEICGEKKCICKKDSNQACEKCGEKECVCPKKIKIKLRDGKEREIDYMINTSFWGADGKLISSQEFLQNLYGELPKFFKDENELRKIWSNPETRKTFLEKLEAEGYGKEVLMNLQKLINAEKSDLFDVLEFISNNIFPITREERVNLNKEIILKDLNQNEKDFVEFVLGKYIEVGVEELSQDKLSTLLVNKYHSTEDAVNTLGGVEKIKSLFWNFQLGLYV